LFGCRPLTAAVAVAGRGKFVLDGVPRMRERPIQDLVDGLAALGVDVKCTLGTGCPPVEIMAEGIRPGRVRKRAPRHVLRWPAGLADLHLLKQCSVCHRACVTWYRRPTMR